MEAVLPADADPATALQQAPGLHVLCASAGNCSAYGTYTDRSGNRQLLLLTETEGAWSPGIRAVLPANAAATQNILEIDAMSCPSAGNCSAVGTYTDSSGSWDGLLLTETAGSWAPAIEAPLPANAASRQMVALLSISCVSAGNCTAVGAYFANGVGDIEGLLLTETAGTWATGIEATLPANAVRLAPPVGLVSVSCASAGNCSAVGTYQDGSGNFDGLLLTETAGSWGPGLEVQLPGNAAAAFSYLYDVFCPSAGDCSAVGGYTDTAGNQEGLLVTETAGTWSPGTEAALPANAASTKQKASVSPPSCPSAGECSAVGSYIDSSGNTDAVLLTETGGSWSPGTEAALPANATTTKQQALIGPPSCPSAGFCSAVGSYIDSSGNVEGLLLTETGGSWSTGIEAVLPGNAATVTQRAFVGPLSCPSAGNCSAVGSYTDSSGNTDGLLLTETSGTWATGEEASLPANAKTPNASVSLSSVFCTSTGNCSAGGSYADDSRGGGFADLLLGGSAPAVKVDVATAGAGAGTVSSAPAGIECGSTCSASFGAGTSLTLTATPSAGSRFSGWSGGGCSGTGSCRVNTGISEQEVTATFGVLKKPCVVPKLTGKRVKAAKRAIWTHNCTVGKVKRAASLQTKKGRVISQKPKAGKRLKHGARINFVVSKGRR